MTDNKNNFSLTDFSFPPPPKKKGVRRKSKGLLADSLNKTLLSLPEIKEEDMKEYVQWWKEMCGYSLYRQFFRDEGNEGWRLRPSGQKCSRAEWLKKNGAKVVEDTSSRGTFLAGDYAEVFTIFMCQLAGHEISDLQREVKIPSIPDGEPDVPGHIDFILTTPTGKRVLVDVKSANNWGFANAKKGLADDSGGYKKQVKTYQMSPDIEVDHGLLLYLNKETWREWTEVMVPAPTSLDKERWYKFCEEVRNEDLPDRPDWAGLKLRPRLKVHELDDWRCRYCSVNGECWKDRGTLKERTKGKKDFILK